MAAELHRPHAVHAWAPSLAQPPLDRPGPGAVLDEFLRTRVQPWGGVPVPLAPGVVGALRAVLALDLLLGGWLLEVRSGVVTCSGPVCWAVTLADHPVLTLVLACAGAVALAGSVPMTRGLRRASGPQLGVIVAGAVSGTAALAGAAAVLIAGVLALALVFGVFVAIVDRL